jgi:hypothetical protein
MGTVIDAVFGALMVAWAIAPLASEMSAPAPQRKLKPITPAGTRVSGQRAQASGRRGRADKRRPLAGG